MGMGNETTTGLDKGLDVILDNAVARRGFGSSASLFNVFWTCFAHGVGRLQVPILERLNACLTSRAVYFAPVVLSARGNLREWVVLICHAAMGAGTLYGGWRIVKTMGMKITKLKPVGGFCAETAGAITLFLATGLGLPVSTTHTISESIMGVGSVEKFSAVRWGVAERIVWAWVLTIPAGALISGISYWIISAFFES